MWSCAKTFGDHLLLAHYYMGGEICKIIKSFGGTIGDPISLAKIRCTTSRKNHSRICRAFHG